MSLKAKISKSWRGDVGEDERRVITSSLETAINAYEANEKTFRQVVEDLQNGKAVPMFAAGDPGIKAARRLADSAFTQAKDAREVLDRWTDDAEAEAS
jgi:ABC-type transporter Mla subunit MlaD